MSAPAEGRVTSSQFQMDEKTPTYYPINGERYLRVTDFLRRRGLVNFDAIPEGDRQFYMDRGTANHELWQRVEEGTDAQYEFDPRVEKYRAAHALFLRETGFRAVSGGIEKRVNSRWSDFVSGSAISEFVGIAGTVDRIGTIGTNLVLIDYKTTQVPPSCAMQTALYAMMTPYKFSDIYRYGVAFRSNGTYSMTTRYQSSDYDAARWHIAQYLKGGS